MFRFQCGDRVFYSSVIEVGNKMFRLFVTMLDSSVTNMAASSGRKYISGSIEGEVLTVLLLLYNSYVCDQNHFEVGF